MKVNVRLIYLYLFSFIGLLISVIGLVRIVDLGMKVYIFKDADKYEFVAPKIEGQEIEINEQKRMQETESKRQRQREFSGALSMILVGVPLYLYHWKKVQKENKN